MDTKELKDNLRLQIVKYTNVLDFTPEQITDDMPLFGPQGLGLDSIDSLELVVLLEREYGIKLTNPTEARKILVDINSMAEYIISVKPQL